MPFDMTGLRERRRCTNGFCDLSFLFFRAIRIFRIFIIFSWQILNTDVLTSVTQIWIIISDAIIAKNRNRVAAGLPQSMRRQACRTPPSHHLVKHVLLSCRIYSSFSVSNHPSLYESVVRIRIVIKMSSPFSLAPRNTSASFENPLRPRKFTLFQYSRRKEMSLEVSR